MHDPVPPEQVPWLEPLHARLAPQSVAEVGEVQLLSEQLPSTGFRHVVYLPVVQSVLVQHLVVFVLVPL